MKTMPKVGIFTGLLLVGLGIAGYFIGGRSSLTAFIPAFFAIPLLIVSALSLKPSFLKLGMHLAATLGLLGFIAPLGMVIPKLIKGSLEWKLSTYSMLAMSVICGIFVALCVKSFIDVRKARKNA